MTITKKDTLLPSNAWIRTCDECGSIQQDKEPKGEMSDAYRNRKCKNCKSETLNYGTQNGSNEDWIND